MRYEVHTGKGKGQEGTVNRRRRSASAVVRRSRFDYIREEDESGGLGAQLMAIVAGGQAVGYIAPQSEHETVSHSARPPADTPDTDLPKQALGFRVQLYGMTKHRDIFTDEQLVALTFNDLIAGRACVEQGALLAGLDATAPPPTPMRLATYSRLRSTGC